MRSPKISRAGNVAAERIYFTFIISLAEQRLDVVLPKPMETSFISARFGALQGKDVHFQVQRAKVVKNDELYDVGDVAEMLIEPLKTGQRLQSERDGSERHDWKRVGLLPHSESERLTRTFQRQSLILFKRAGL